MAKLRLTISEDPGHQPDGVNVVGRQRFGWVALLAAYAALFCLPAFRDSMVGQSLTVITGRPPEWLSGISGTAGFVGEKATERHRKRLRGVLAKQSTDVELQLGALVLGIVDLPDSSEAYPGSPEDRSFAPKLDRDLRLEYLAELRQRYPSNPAVLATSLRYSCLGAVVVRRRFKHPEQGKSPTHDRLLAPTIADELLDLAERGESVEPGNAFFPALAAIIEVAAGRDERAIKAMNRAGRSTFWKDYSWAEGGGGERLLILTYGDHGLLTHALPLAAVLLPHYGQLRNAYHVLEAQLDGTSSGWQLRADMLHVGGLLRDDGETLIGRLVGAALQEIALGTADGHRGGQGSEATARAKQEKVRELLVQVEREAPAVLATFKRESEGLAKFRAKRQRLRQVGARWDRLMQPAIRRELLGLHLIGNLLGCLALWGFAAALLFAGEKLKRLRPGAIHPWAPTAIGITAAAAVMCTLVALWPWEFAVLTAHGWWMSQLDFMRFIQGESPGPEPAHPLGSILARGPAPLVPFVCLCTVIAALRQRAGVGGWLEGLRGSVRVLTAVLAVGYLVFTLVHVPATLRDGRIASQNFRNETAILDQP
jgi:hypothetical protein